MHVQNSEEETKQKVQKIINPVISRSLHQLLSSNENVRIQNGLNLVQQLQRKSPKNQSAREHKYVLKRLMRGTGGSNSASKCGFYTALVAYLNAFKETVSLDEIFEVLDNELKVCKKATTKENADAFIGHILVVTALQKTELLKDKKKTAKALEYVLAASEQKAYHYKLSYNCLITFLTSQTEEEFRKTLFPFMKKNLKTPWEEQTMHSLHFLMEAHMRFPTLIDEAFLEDFLGHKNILDSGSFEKIFELFWKDKPETEIMQPAYDTLGKISATSKNFSKFWTFIVDKTMEHPNKAKEVITVKLATDALNCENLGKAFTKIFNEKFLEMIFMSLRQSGSKDEVLKAIYMEFFDALFEAVKRRKDKQMAIVQKLVTHPGTLLIDKYQFSNKILHRIINIMNGENLKELTEFLKKILIDQETKNATDSAEKWLNSEKVVAVQVLQRIISSKLLAADSEWKLLQAKFILNNAIFYSNDGESVVKKPEICVVPIELANHMMNLFYHGLESTFSTMEAGKVILSGLVDHCNAILTKKNPQKYLRRDFSEKSLKMWEEMYRTVSELDGEKFVVFQVLLLSMGLQLFRDAELAEESLKELQSCVVRAKEKKSKLRKNEEEPEWIEVLMDLILHLLSQGSSILKNIIKKVFPSLCPKLNLSAIYQILSLLDMKDGQNPLKYDNEEDSEGSEGEDEIKVNGKHEDSEEESGEEEDEDDEDQDEDEVDDEGTVSDKLRSAVSAALGFGAAVESDQESVNLDDMTEEEGKRLDDALSTAFKMLKENKPRRKTKKDHREDTTLVHFRNRLMDLLMIYLKHSPELGVTLEIMITLYDMLPYCVDEDSKPLLGKIQETLTVLVNVRNFRNDSQQVVDSGNLLNALMKLCKKNENPHSMEVRNSFVIKGIKFIIFCCSKISAPSELIEEPIGNFLTEFINSRNPTLTYNFFSNIFNSPWSGLLHLTEKIIENGLTTTTRSFRRIQSFDLLTILYKNHRLFQLDSDRASKTMKKVEQAVGDFLSKIASESVSLHEFKSLTTFLWEVHRCHRQLPTLKAKMKWKEAMEKVQEVRIRLQLDLTAMNNYSKICSVLGETIVKNSSIQKPSQENGSPEEDTEMADAETNGTSPAKGKKRKQQPNHLKMKKTKKLARLEASAEGLGDGISFAEKVEYSDDE